jgi:diguanylate cyclase (GGDEF)-like protein/PAS domain S-box-containing protein
MHTGQAMISTEKDNQGQRITRKTGDNYQPVDVHMDKPQFYENLIQTLPVISYVTRLGKRENRCRFISGNVKEILGFDPNEMMNSVFWLSRVHPEDKQTVLDKIQQNIGHGQGFVQYRFRASNDNYHWILDQHRVLYENSLPVEIIGAWIDITDQKNIKIDQDYYLEHDSLTGLVNRKILQHRIETMVKMNFFGEGHVLCYLDVDQFRVINTAYGHDAGDALLRQLSGIIKDHLGKRDLLARLDGDEFGILLEYCTLEQAQRILKNIQDAIQDYRFDWKDKRLAFTVSIGVVAINENVRVPTSFLSMAYTACSTAKEEGRNRIRVYSGPGDKLTERQNEMQFVEQINKALEEDRFVLYYQPIVSLDQNVHTRHHELLIRMKGEDGNIIPPGLFLAAAERYNLSSKIDRWVIQTTLSWLDAYSDLQQKDYSWGINLSGQSLGDESLLDFVIDELDRKQIAPDKIYFEITETAAISNLDHAIRFIKALKQLGCRFALDDFGSGLSSFSYLKNLPIDYIKIDGVFIKNILNDNFDLSLVKSINNTAHDLGKITIAEFVENDAIREKLKILGVDYVQGYAICKPMPLSEFSM